MTRQNTTTPDAALSEVFEVLSHRYRRRILVKLDTSNPYDRDEFTSDEMADDGENLDVFHSELFHNHLPKLDEAGIIDWNRETDTIRRGPRFDEIIPLLRLMADHQDELPEDWS